MGWALAKRRHIAMSDDRELVFVYGTLRKGASNHWRMEEAEFMGPATVRGRLYLVDWYPALKLDQSAREVKGEVYEVSTAQLASLDAFEGAEYERIKSEVMRVSPYFRQEVWLYKYLDEVDESGRIESGDWMDVEHPPPAPLFPWIAWSPILLLLPAILIAELAGTPHEAEVAIVPLTLILGSLVMVIGGYVAMKRRERPRGLAAPPLLLGFLVLSLVTMVLLALFVGG